MALVPRSEIDPADRWNLSVFYSSDAAWETDLQAAAGWPDKIAAFQGRLGESAEVLADAIETYMAANRALEKIYVYSHLRHDEDQGNSTCQAMQERARSSYIRLMAASAYLAPELLTIPDETMQGWMSHARLVPYRIWLEEQLRGKPYTLSQPEERILAMLAEPLGALSNIYSVLKNVDLAARLPEVNIEGQEPVQLTHATFVKALENKDRAVRRAAFDGYYREYRGNRATIAATLEGAVKSHTVLAQLRGFGSALEAALFNDNVQPAVYNSLIEAVHNALPAFYRYIEVRKKLLGLDPLHLYDAYVPAVDSVDLNYSYDEAVELVLKALAPLGAEYTDQARKGLLGGWVDRYENAGKRSGAYSSGCYDSWPYILMNYTGTLNSVSTLAHELGHSMHTYLSHNAQPYQTADYRILVAEVASTTNENLLTHYLLEQNSDKAVKAYLIDRQLDTLRGTLYRQTMFSEFEKLIHEQAEAGQPLTVDSLDETYYNLVKLYFGPGVAFDEEDAPIAWEWARVDHFFYNFYVYKYAAGIASAIAISGGLLANEPHTAERYFAFLRSGSSKYPLELLKDAGVDLTTPEPVAEALSEFDRLTSELERLLA
ncbi:MAG: oligoendopeptidase F [Chloroflexi bacterium]|nr:oligoendopeptidase F [Chloroflexota bacterium]